VYVKLRPYLREFLEQMSSSYELVVFATGSEMYCSPVLDCIEEGRKYFAHRVFGDHLLFQGMQYPVKHYDFLFRPPRNHDNTLIVDLSPTIYCMKMCNGIPITPYKPAEPISDLQLVHLAQYLEVLKKETNVATAIGSAVRAALVRPSINPGLKAMAT
jgi:TFIIF-interacting CTD phosphatase-like protein